MCNLGHGLQTSNLYAFTEAPKKAQGSQWVFKRQIKAHFILPFKSVRQSLYTVDWPYWGAKDQSFKVKQQMMSGFVLIDKTARLNPVINQGGGGLGHCVIKCWAEIFSLVLMLAHSERKGNTWKESFASTEGHVYYKSHPGKDPRWTTKLCVCQ